MSIQDESFPNELFDELIFSPKPGKSFQFPNDFREKCQNKLALSTSTAKGTTTNLSKSSASDQNLSSGSSNQGQLLPITLSKRTASDPDDNQEKISDCSENCQQHKTLSFQEIHSEYTRRRFKHVESKVAKYIANMKAEDQKHRQAKFQRHSSLPNTYSGQRAMGDSQRITHFSAGDLNCMNESTSDADGEADSCDNTTATTSSSSGCVATTATTNSSTDGSNKNLDGNKATLMQIMNEKERIQSHNDYLQSRLDEKISENMRLKRNVEFMRIELTNCKDKLNQKQTTSMTSLGVGIAGHLPLQMLFCNAAKSVKATQTDLKTPPILTQPQQPSLYITPSTPDANNNTMYDSGSNTGKGGKSVATIQPLSLNFSNIAEQYGGEGSNGNVGLRQRSNSNSTDQRESKNKKNTKTNSSGGCPSSSDSAIDIESAELASPKAMKLLCKQERMHFTRSQRHEEFIYYDKRSGRYAELQALNVGADPVVIYDENDDSSGMPESTNRKTKKRFSLRRRWLRIFGPCTRCQDQNNTMDSSAFQQTYTQIPLLEKSLENHCRRNIR